MIQIRGTSTAASSATNPNSLPVISGVQDGDLILLAVGNSAVKTPAPPAGFSLIDGTGNTQSISIYKKLASGESGSYSVGWTPSGSGRQILGAIALYSDTGATLLIDAHAAQNNTTIDGNHTCPGVTTSLANAFLACFFVLFANTGSSPAGDMTEQWDYDTFVRFYCMTGSQATAGATGAKTATSLSGGSSSAVTVAIVEHDPTPYPGTGAILQVKVSGSYTDIAQVRDVKGPSYGANAIDVSTRDSTSQSKEFVYGEREAGEVVFAVVFDPDLTTHSMTQTGGMGTDLRAGTIGDFALVFPNETTTATFSALVTKYEPTAPYDGALTADVTLRITGPVSWA